MLLHLFKKYVYCVIFIISQLRNLYMSINRCHWARSMQLCSRFPFVPLIKNTKNLLCRFYSLSSDTSEMTGTWTYIQQHNRASCSDLWHCKWMPIEAECLTCRFHVTSQWSSRKACPIQAARCNTTEGPVIRSCQILQEMANGIARDAHKRHSLIGVTSFLYKQTTIQAISGSQHSRCTAFPLFQSVPYWSTVVVAKAKANLKL